MTDAPDTGAVGPGAGTYSERRANPSLNGLCGCTGVPDGQHIAGCPFSKTPEATQCAACGVRSADIARNERHGARFYLTVRCGQCGIIKGEKPGA